MSTKPSVVRSTPQGLLGATCQITAVAAVGACQIHKTKGFDALLAPGTKLNLE